MYVLGMRQQRTGKSVDRRPVSFCDRFCVTLRSRTKRSWTCSRSGRSARRAGLGEARFVILQDSHIDLVLFVGFLISFSEQAIIAAAGRRLRTLPGVERCRCPRLSQDLFFRMRYVRKSSYFSLLLACRTIRRIRRKLLWVPSLLFLLSIPWPSFHCCTRHFVLQCLTGVHGAFVRIGHPIFHSLLQSHCGRHQAADPGADRGCVSTTDSRGNRGDCCW